MKRVSYRIGALMLALAVLAGCAEQTAKGTILGAGTGAFVGAASAKSPEGALLGAVIGGLLGAFVGESIAHQETRAAAASPPPRTATPAPPPPPPGWAVVTAPAPVGPTGPPAPPPDPTRGVIANGTPWEIHIFIDQPPGSPGPLVLRPSQSAPVNLDVGQHRIVAQAFVDTQFGRRLVGTFDRTLTVDPRAPGWTIHFFPANF